MYPYIVIRKSADLDAVVDGSEGVRFVLEPSQFALSSFGRGLQANSKPDGHYSCKPWTGQRDTPRLHGCSRRVAIGGLRTGQPMTCRASTCGGFWETALWTAHLHHGHKDRANVSAVVPRPCRHRYVCVPNLTLSLSTSICYRRSGMRIRRPQTSGW